MHLGVTWFTCHLDKEGYFLDISKLRKYEEEISRGLSFGKRLKSTGHSGPVLRPQERSRSSFCFSLKKFRYRSRNRVAVPRGQRRPRAAVGGQKGRGRRLAMASLGQSEVAPPPWPGCAASFDGTPRVCTAGARESRGGRRASLV